MPNSTPASRMVQIGVAENHGGRLAAQFQRHRHQLLRRLRGDAPTGAVPPVKLTVATSGCVTSGSPTSPPLPGNAENRPLGRPAASIRRRQLQADQRRTSPRASAPRVAGGERRGDLLRVAGDRAVPRRDRGDDADRLVPRSSSDSRRAVASAGTSSVSQATAMKRKVAGGPDATRARVFGQGLAGVAGLDPGRSAPARRDSSSEIACRARARSCGFRSRQPGSAIAARPALTAAVDLRRRGAGNGGGQRPVGREAGFDRPGPRPPPTPRPGTPAAAGRRG